MISYKNYWQQESGDYQASPWTAYNNSVATTQSSTPRTAAVSGASPSVGPVWTGAGYDQAPEFDVADLGFTQGYEQAGSSDGASGIRIPDNFGFNAGVNAVQKYGEHYGNMSSFSDNYMTQYDPNNPDKFTLNIKSGDKQGTPIEYTKQGNKWVPTTRGTDWNWNTNVKGTDYAPLAIMAAPFAVAGGMALAGAGGGAAGAGAGGAIGSTVGESTLSSMMAGGLGGGSTGGALGGGISSAAGTLGGGLLPTGAAGTLGGTFGGLTQIGAYGGALGGSLGGLAGSGGAGMGGSSLWDTAKQGYDYYKKAKQGMNLFNQMTQDPRASAPRTGWDSLAGLAGGLYSEHQNRDAFTGLNDLFSRMEQQRAPYQQALTESYANPNSYLQSPEYQALAKIEQNRLDRRAGATGRLSNDADRAVLMQDHAQKNLGNYRQGLQGALSANQLPYGIFSEAARRTGNAGGAGFGGLGYSGVLGQGGLSGIVNGVSGGLKSLNDIFGRGYGESGGASEPTSSLDMGGGIGYGDIGGSQEPVADVSNWNWDNPSSWDFGGWF